MGNLLTKKLTVHIRFPIEKYPEIQAIFNKTLNLLPYNVIEYFEKNPFVFSTETSDQRANAMMLTKNDFKDNDYMIHINHHVWEYDEKTIVDIILHEIAHVYLRHISDPKMSTQTYDKQEREAEKLKNEWLELARINKN